MTDSQELLDKLRDIDPVARTDQVHDDDDAAVLFSSILQRRDEMVGTRTHKDRSQVRPPAPPRRSWVLAAAAAALVIMAVGLPLWLLGGPSGDIADTGNEPIATTAASPAPTTAETPVSPAPETSAAPTTTPAPPPFSGVVSLDPDAAMQFGSPSVAFDSAGRAQVLYARTQSSTALAVCEDPGCSSVAIHEILEGTGSRLQVGTPRYHRGPVFWVGGGGDLHPEAALVICSDIECLEPSVPMSVGDGSAPPAIAVDPSGRLIVVSHELYPTLVTTYTCEDASCANATSATWEPQEDLWLGPLPSAAWHDGLPVIALQAQQGLLIATCAEPDCAAPPAGSGIEVIADIPVDGIGRGPYLTFGSDGEPVALIGITGVDESATTWVGKLAVVACVDPSCSDWVITELAESEDMYWEWAIAAGPDGRVRAAWTEYDTVFLATCHNNTCSDRSIIDIGHPADDIGLTFDGNGAPVIATMSRERGLELIFCGDDSCRIGG